MSSEALISNIKQLYEKIAQTILHNSNDDALKLINMRQQLIKRYCQQYSQDSTFEESLKEIMKETEELSLLGKNSQKEVVAQLKSLRKGQKVLSSYRQHN